ncbi:hypothetical protein ATHSA_0366 [Athalassotoga saccharophila]|nr:hypothetical protein ATHSA_0366 [Athalassotoga saccharophila]
MIFKRRRCRRPLAGSKMHHTEGCIQTLQIRLNLNTFKIFEKQILD